MTQEQFDDLEKFVCECEFEATQEAVESGMGIVGWEIMIMFHPLYDDYLNVITFLDMFSSEDVRVA